MILPAAWASLRNSDAMLQCAKDSWLQESRASQNRSFSNPENGTPSTFTSPQSMNLQLSANLTRVKGTLKDRHFLRFPKLINFHKGTVPSSRPKVQRHPHLGLRSSRGIASSFMQWAIDASKADRQKLGQLTPYRRRVFKPCCKNFRATSCHFP